MARTVSGGTPKKAFSASKMFDELSVGPPRVLVGAVKVCEDDQKAVMFSKDMNCRDWLKIPETLISGYEQIGQVACGDHRHPVVRIYLRAPQTASEAAFLLADATAFVAPPVIPASARLGNQAAGALVQASYYPDKGGNPCVTDANGQSVYPGTGVPCP